MKKLKAVAQNISEILFIDIETCALAPNYMTLNPIERKHWDTKADRLKKPSDSDFGTSKDQFYERRAGIYAEFSRVVCISVGYLDVIAEHKAVMTTKSFFHINEASMLMEFSEFLQSKFIQNEISFLCGHNIKEFDIPFICRRMIVNGILLPDILRVAGKKPWQIPFTIDTLELWKFGDYKSYISLELLCNILNVKSPKDKMSGAEVHKAFWVDKAYSAIYEYCEYDVFATAQVYTKIKQVGLKLNFVHRSKTTLQ